MKIQEIRKKFVDHFQTYNHIKNNSSELVPINDPTLMFANSGMVQFKDFFTGKAIAPNKRVVTIQKCVRAGGKHNDLENVGFTARHHTFFEMLGNFSFGDYFKEEAIRMAWEFLTEKLKMPKDKLYITAHHSDQEAADIWLKKIGIPKDHFSFRGDKDNFWEMGEVGPCGPCSEIFYDHGPEFTDPNFVKTDCVLDDENRYVEIWNLVFMQFEKYFEGKEIKRRPLPNPCIDTGSGLERVAAALQGKYNNFDTDAFTPIIEHLETLTKKSYKDKKYTTSFRVVADHVRAGTMMITDGVIPSNEGRGYVLRRILRRAIRHLNLLDVKEPILHLLVEDVFKILGQEYPENLRNKEMAIKFLKSEEDSFRKTLTTGLQLLEKEVERLHKSNKDTLEGEVLFKLYDTQGFPIDLIELLLKEKSMKMDVVSFDKLMEEQKKRSRNVNAFAAKEDNLKLFYNCKEKHGESEFLGYSMLKSNSKLNAKILLEDDIYALVFDKTPFYGESGGQAGDIGLIQVGTQKLNVTDTLKPVEGVIAHIVTGADSLKEGSSYELNVDAPYRGLIAKNHTATHLLHAALRNVLGSHVKQAGSLVNASRLRFDFSHPESVSKEEIQKVERMVNEQIFMQTPAVPTEMSKDQAVKKGAMALFGEKYGDKVRVLEIGSFSLELCGGTHVSNTQEINLFKIVSESALSAGVRRIEAVTSFEALKLFENSQTQLNRVENLLHANTELVVERVEQLQANIKESDREIRQLKEKLQAHQAHQMLDAPQSLKNGWLFKAIRAPEASDIRQIGDMFIDKYKSGIVLVTTTQGPKASVLLKTFKGNTQINCSDILKNSLKDFGGSGGGKPEMAQGSISTDHLKAVENKITEVIFTSI